MTEGFKRKAAALKAASDAKEVARIAIEEQSIAKHKKEMSEKRAEFEKKFKMIWSTGPTGCSIFYVTTQSGQAG